MALSRCETAAKAPRSHAWVICQLTSLQLSWEFPPQVFIAESKADPTSLFHPVESDGRSYSICLKFLIR